MVQQKLHLDGRQMQLLGLLYKNHLQRMKGILAERERLRALLLVGN